MQHVTLLLIGLHLGFAGKHSLKYFYTSMSGDIDLTGFTVGLIDDSPIMYFNIKTEKCIPKTAWMRENELTDYLERQRDVMIYEYTRVIHKIFPARSRGLHTYQIMYGCEWDDETGETNGFRRFAYNGEEVMFLDLKEMKYISPLEQGSFSQMCNNLTWHIIYWKHYFETECIESLKKYLQFGKSSLEKTVSPQVSLLQKDLSSPVICHATGFYPSEITIIWLKNQQALRNRNFNAGKVLPNDDGTFQKSVTLTVEPHEWKQNVFSCVVEHARTTVRKTLTETEIRTNNAGKSDSSDIIIAAYVVILLVVIGVIGVIGYVVCQRKLKSGFVRASNSDSSFDSDSSIQTATKA